MPPAGCARCAAHRGTQPLRDGNGALARSADEGRHRCARGRRASGGNRAPRRQANERVAASSWSGARGVCDTLRQPPPPGLPMNVLPFRKPAPRQRRKVANVGQGSAARDAILQAAQREFAAKGLGGARVDEIAQRAGANKQLIYYYFGSKDDLYRAALEAVYAEIRELERGLNLGGLPPLEAME